MAPVPGKGMCPVSAWKSGRAQRQPPRPMSRHSSRATPGMLQPPRPSSSYSSSSSTPSAPAWAQRRLWPSPTAQTPPPPSRQKCVLRSKRPWGRAATPRGHRFTPRGDDSPYGVTPPPHGVTGSPHGVSRHPRPGFPRRRWLIPFRINALRPNRPKPTPGPGKSPIPW